MREAENHPVEPPAEQSRVEEVYRRERRAFRWTCGWTCFVALAGLSQLGIGFWYNREFSKMAGSPDPLAYRGLMEKTLPVMAGNALALLISLIGFSICLIRWLLAIRQRRRTISNSFLGR